MENEKKVEARKYEFRLHLIPEIAYREFNMYTLPEATNEIDIIDLYATQERIDKWKEELIQKIKDCKNPFDITIGDTDQYPVPESEIFEMPEGYVKSELPDDFYF